MTLQQLRCVSAIAEKGSMSEAAKSLYLSQPTLSATLKELERELGFSIFLRTNRGMALSPEGMEFLSYAKSVLTQENLLEARYFGETSHKATLSISTQHYGFVTDCFLKMMEKNHPEEFSFSVKEQRMATIISDIRAFRADIGIISVDSRNEKMMLRYLKENHMEFHSLTQVKPHVLLSSKSPLSSAKTLKLEDLSDLTYLFFEQRNTDPLYFSEEVVSSMAMSRKIGVSDRATIFTLLDRLPSYTVTSGMASSGIVEGSMVSIPLETDETMKIGYLKLENSGMSSLAMEYIEELTKMLSVQE